MIPCVIEVVLYIWITWGLWIQWVESAVIGKTNLPLSTIIFFGLIIPKCDEDVPNRM